MSNKENVLIKNKHILLCFGKENINNIEFDYLKNNFCGVVLEEINDYNIFSSSKIVYLCGNLNKFDIIKNIKNKIIYVIKELSSNYEICDNYKIINIGMVPINVHNVGVYFRNLFDPDKDYFNLIKKEHV